MRTAVAPAFGASTTTRLAREFVRGMAVQIDPIKPALKPPGTKRLKLKCDKRLSILLQFYFQI